MSNSSKIDLTGVSEFSDVVSQELAAALKLNIDFLQNLCAIGQVAPILTGIVGVPLPDANIWQLCDGSEIVNENSPLRSQGASQHFTPNMTNRFQMMVKPGGQSAGTLGGENNTYAFKHNHGGYTGSVGSNQDGNHSHSLREAAFSHNHTIAYDFNYGVNVEPPFYTVKFYMRIQ
jgi:hypothetical protein